MYENDLYRLAQIDGRTARPGTMANQRSPTSWGKGRTVFVSRLETIRGEIGEGLLLTTIYERHKAALGIGYAGFCKLVARYADDAKPLRSRPVPTVPAGPSPPSAGFPPAAAGGTLASYAPPISPVPLTSKARAHARYEPAARPDFKHHGIVQEGEPEQLFGPGFLPKRRT